MVSKTTIRDLKKMLAKVKRERDAAITEVARLSECIAAIKAHERALLGRLRA